MTVIAVTKIGLRRLVQLLGRLFRTPCHKDASINFCCCVHACIANNQVIRCYWKHLTRKLK